MLFFFILCFSWQWWYTFRTGNKLRLKQTGNWSNWRRVDFFFTQSNIFSVRAGMSCPLWTISLSLYLSPTSPGHFHVFSTFSAFGEARTYTRKHACVISEQGDFSGNLCEYIWPYTLYVESRKKREQELPWWYTGRNLHGGWLYESTYPFLQNTVQGVCVWARWRVCSILNILLSYKRALSTFVTTVARF